MRISEESPAERRNIDDLVQIIQDQDADPRAVTQCLLHLAELLEKLGDPRASMQVKQSLERD